uniref:uncharacterized protein LOC117701266 isoform X1 n=1 Tax=Arvicanthis niloticus TaxID=61156 RepID=UPI001486B88D|nr:uncharacterized protein LOC117701266 isoform X1 [Arvicanthis niloticus]
MHTDAQAEVVNVEECPEAGTEVEIVEVQAATQRMPFELIQVWTPSHSSITPDLNAATSISTGMRTSTSSSSTDISSTTPVSYDEDSEDKKDPKFQEVIVGQEQGHQKAPEAAPSIPTTALQAVHPEAVVEPTVHTDLQVHNAEPRKTYQYQRPLIGEKFAQLCGPRVLMTEVYDLNISRSFHDEKHSYPDIEEEDREQEQCEYEFAQCIEMLQNLKYERPGQHQTGQGQGSCVHRSREQVVTVIDDLGSPTMEFFGNDNSQHSQNETHRCWEDPIDCAPPLLHHSSRSCQEMTASHQTLAASCQATLPSCQASFVSCPASLPSCSASAPSCIVPVPIHKESVPICQVSAPISEAYAPLSQTYASKIQPSAQLCQVLAASYQASGLLCQASVVTHQVSAPRCQSLAVSHQASAPPCQASATSCHASVVSQQVLAASYHQSAMSPHASFDHRRENIPCFLPPWTRSLWFLLG